ncbi:MAG: hypothetical protein Sup05_1286 [uncultured Candidatus Thioglobus sp.]|nr:MAG: hypothetical protein Sup05_1286 [uncultured Candidatus Thioglobus sp.]
MAESSTAFADNDFSILLVKPANTLPGPDSTNFSTPILCMTFTVPVHNTGLCNWATSFAFISLVSVALAASTLCNTSTSPMLNLTASTALANTVAASSINEQCEGTLTGNITARLAPAAFMASQVASTASLLPATTTCPLELKFTASTMPSPV